MLKAEIPSASFFFALGNNLEMMLMTKLTLHASCNVLCSSNQAIVNIKNSQHSNYVCTASCMNENVFIFKNEFIHLVSTFVLSFKGTLGFFLWHLRDFAGQKITAWQMVGCAACLSETAEVH